MRKSFGISFIITVVALIFFSMTNDSTSALIVFFILYPFAKIVYDILLGFKLSFKIKKQDFSTIYLTQFHYLLNFLVYMFSLVIAPFGVLYLILRAIYRFIKKRRLS